MPPKKIWKKMYLYFEKWWLILKPVSISHDMSIAVADKHAFWSVVGLALCSLFSCKCYYNRHMAYQAAKPE